LNSKADFIVGTFLEPSDELKAKGFVGYNASVMESNFWPDYSYNEDTGRSHDLSR